MQPEFPQLEVGVHMGGKPDPDLQMKPSYGFRLGADQIDEINKGGYSFEGIVFVGGDEYGVKNHIRVTDKDAEVEFRTLQLLTDNFQEMVMKY